MKRRLDLQTLLNLISIQCQWCHHDDGATVEDSLRASRIKVSFVRER